MNIYRRNVLYAKIPSSHFSIDPSSANHNILKVYLFFLFFEQNKCDILCELSAMIYMKYQDLFSLKNKKKEEIYSVVSYIFCLAL